jgi:hypothetical protein
MAVTITSVAASGVAPRSLQATSTGRLWVAAGNTSADTIEFWYSDDAGATWTENTSAQITWSGGSYFAFYIDADDHAHIAYDELGTVALKYRRNKSISTTSAWSAASTVDSTTALSYQWADMVAHREGTGWKAHILYKRNTTGADLMLWAPITITSADVITVETKVTVDSNVGGANGAGGIDFHHTASDEKAIQSSTPHLYMVWCDGSLSVNFAKYTYSGGSWTAGTTRVIYTGAATPSAQMVFDGSRVIITLVDGANVGLFERDAADTTTTTRSAVAVPVTSCVTYDNDSNVWIAGGGAPGDLYVRKFVRSTLTWASAELVDTDNPGICAMRRTGGNTIAIAYQDLGGGGARFDQTYNNVAPSSPTWVNVDNVGADVGAALVLDWNFVDANPGDAQTAYTLRRQIGAGSYAYWKASDSTWDAAVQKITSATSAVTQASGWGADGDANHKFAVLVYDALDTVSPYSAELTVTPSVPAVPVITTPTDGGTVASASLTAVWTCTSQATYLVELLNSAETTVLHSSGVVTDSVSRSYVIPYTLVNGTSYKVRVTCVNAEGLAATPDTNSFSVSYTAPATPTVVVTPSTSLAKITVTPTQPTPGGGQPTVTSIDIFVRCAAGRNYPDGERPVGGVGIRVGAALPPSTAWVDYPSAGVAYEYMVRANADNGTYADSAWTA